MSTTRIDPIATEIVRTELEGAAQELTVLLERGAKTFYTYYLKDRVVALIDAEHRVMSQSDGCPLMLGNQLGEISRHLEEANGRDAWHEGDVWIVNDPYITGTHLNDVVVLGPVFDDDALVGFVASLVNWLDVGTKSDMPWPMDSTELFGEGVRITPVRIVEGGEPRRDVIELLCRNGRYATYNEGDLDVQLACIELGRERLRGMLARHGRDGFLAAREALCAETERFERAAIAAIPDGTYRAEGCIDDDGISGEPCWIRVAIEVRGDAMTIDLSESDDAQAGPVNCGAAQGISVARLAFKGLFSPARPLDGGSFAALDVVVREGSVLGAQEPSPCGAFFRTLCLLYDLVAQALADVAPDVAYAASFDDSILAVLPEGSFPYFEAPPGGWGAWAGSDGEGGLISKAQGALKDPPIEWMETSHPVRIARYGFRTDSGGAGRWRGGCGLVRELVWEGDPARLLVLFERAHTPHWGVRGGQEGAHSVVVLNPGGDDERSLRRCVDETVKRGDVIRALTGGGGGYGDPRERDPELVRADVRAGYVSPEAARDVYGTQP